VFVIKAGEEAAPRESAAVVFTWTKWNLCSNWVASVCVEVFCR